jgi:hypothetical protein
MMADTGIAKADQKFENIISDFINSHREHPDCYALDYRMFIVYVVAWVSARMAIHWRSAYELAVVIAVRKDVRETISAPDPQSLAWAVQGLSEEGKSAFFLALLDN